MTELSKKQTHNENRVTTLVSMTRATTVQHSTSNNINNFQSRGNGNLQQRTFKKSHARDRAALSTISLNSNHRNNRNNSKVIRRKHNNANNPFTSFEPNKSGIICDDENSNEPSDFSHFLTPQNSPPITTRSNVNNPQTQPLNDSNSNSRSKQYNNNSHSNFISSQSRSNENVILNEQHPTPQPHLNQNNNNNNNKESTDDFILAALQRCNSMTVPFQDNHNKNNNHKNQLQPLSSIQRSLSDSNLNNNNNNNNNINNKKEVNKRYSLEYIPFDWCLKKRLYFVSDQSLEWCCNISLKLRNAAMHQIPLESLNIESEIEKKQYEFYKNMIYYQYPHNQWDQSQLSILHKFYLKNSQNLKPLQKVGDRNNSKQFGIVSNMANTFENGPNGTKNIGEYTYNQFIDRLCEWMESFHSLYALFRQNFCKYIYIHFPNFFNVIFFYDSDEMNSNPSVLITNTHQSFRNNLKKQNIIFSTPLMDINNNKENENKNDKDDDDDDDDFEMDLEELQRNGINIRMNKKRTKNGLGLRYNNKDRTIVLIEGKRNIHNFYDYLINYMHRLCLSIKKCHDIPLLFCDKIFLNSKCRLITMSKNNCGLTETKQKMYTMQLDGNILPSIQYSIIDILSKSSSEQNTTISFQLHDKMMTGINYCSKSKLFKKLKDIENRNFTSLLKIELSGKGNNCIVHLQ